MKMAGEHYSRALIKFYGLYPLKTFLSRQKEQYDQADLYDELCKKKTIFRNWMDTLRLKRAEKELKADRIYELKLTKQLIQTWKRVLYHLDNSL